MIERQIDAIIGLQMGDEGKGRFAHDFAKNYSMVARFNGGANAGHTFMFNGKEINTHQVPSGITHAGVMNLITLSSLVDPLALTDETNDLWSKGIPVSRNNLLVSDGAHLVLPHHIMLDEIREAGKNGQGSTKRGIAPAAAQKYERAGVTLTDFEHDVDYVKRAVIDGIDSVNRLIDDLALRAFHDQDINDEERYKYINKLYELIRVASDNWRDWQTATDEVCVYKTETVSYIHGKLGKGARLLAEGAQSSGLDIEHGVRRETTSSHVTVGGALNSIGIGPGAIGEVFGVAKLTKSRVGGTADSFPTLITDPEVAANLRGERGAVDSEYGKSTGRERQIGWLDLPELRRAIRVNGVTQLLLTKLDCVPRAGATTDLATHFVDLDGNRVEITPNSTHELKKLRPFYETMSTWDEDISAIRDFDDLPETAKAYIRKIEKELDGTPVKMIGVGPDSEQIISR